MKNRSAILFWLDFTLLVLMGSLVTTGIILRWVLPPGTGGGGGFGAHRAAAKRLMDLSRHEWGDVHLWIAGALFVLIILHLTLHWGWISTCIPRYLLHRNNQRVRATTTPSAAPSAGERSD